MPRERRKILSQFLSLPYKYLKWIKTKVGPSVFLKWRKILGELLALPWGKYLALRYARNGDNFEIFALSYV